MTPTDPRPTPEYIRFIDATMGPGWWHLFGEPGHLGKVTRCGIRLVNKGRIEARFTISLSDPFCDVCEAPPE